jgi:hypothetical protein
MNDNLRSRITAEEFDYLALLHALREYSRPRDRITKLLQRGEIIRVKKGIYVFGERNAARPFSRETLANMLCGPSYISHDWALHYHGLIAERPTAVSSAVYGRPQSFSTPVGLFLYRPLPLFAYGIGIDLATPAGAPPFLIATPEKALADKVNDARGIALTARRQMKSYLLDHLRIAPRRLLGLDVQKLNIISFHYRSPRLMVLNRLIRLVANGEERLP